LRTIYRDGRLFDTGAEKKEADRMVYVDNLMKEICAEYSDVYYIDTPNQTGTDMLTSADGVHPCSWGYKRWADTIQPSVVEILAKYGIK
jgi:lysophospholipase L1-like esterase